MKEIPLQTEYERKNIRTILGPERQIQILKVVKISGAKIKKQKQSQV